MGPEMARKRRREARSSWPRSTTSRPIKDYVDMVYKTFKPFDYETGEGIVVAAPKESLLRPAVFCRREGAWPRQDLVRPGAALDSATLLEVIAQVNKNAKDWDSAIIREI